MNDQLIEDFTRIRVLGDTVVLEVAIVRWPGPHTPELRWYKYRTWSKTADAAELTAAQEKALVSRRFFRICQRCGERCNTGHMHDDAICQGCAEEHLGVIH